MIESLTGLCAVAAFLKFGYTAQTLINFLFICLLIVITFIDLDHQIIPDIITIPSIPLFMLCSIIIPDMTLKDSIIGSAFGGGLLLIVAIGYKALMHRDGMGYGDIKFLAMIGALIGLNGVIVTVFTASLLGTLIGLISIGKGQPKLKKAIPFGPFLSIGAMIYLFWGSQLTNWYFIWVS